MRSPHGLACTLLSSILLIALTRVHRLEFALVWFVQPLRMRRRSADADRLRMPQRPAGA